MLSIDRWWLITAPTDLRYGMDRLLLQVQAVRGRAAAEAEAYVFANRSGRRIKLLCCDRHGVWLAVRRLHHGSFHWPRTGDEVWSLSAQQYAWLCAGVDWQRLSITPMCNGQRL
jgi:transposase